MIPDRTGNYYGFGAFLYNCEGCCIKISYGRGCCLKNPYILLLSGYPQFFHTDIMEFIWDAS